MPSSVETSECILLVNGSHENVLRVAFYKNV